MTQNKNLKTMKYWNKLFKNLEKSAKILEFYDLKYNLDNYYNHNKIIN